MRNLSPYFCGNRGRLKHIENGPEAHRLARPLDHSGLESLRRNIEHLIRERHLGLANKLIDRYQPTLRSGSFESEFALGLQEIQTQVASLFPPAGDADPFSDASKFDLAQEAPFICHLSIGDGVAASLVGPMLLSWTFSLARMLAEMWELASSRIYENKKLAGHMRSLLWLLSRLVLIPKPPNPPSSVRDTLRTTLCGSTSPAQTAEDILSSYHTHRCPSKKSPAVSASARCRLSSEWVTSAAVRLVQ